jgi:hypothetical protein
MSTRKPRITPSSFDPKQARRIAASAASQALAQYDAKHVEEMVATVLNKGLPTAIATALETVGIDTSNPEELRKDMVHLRTWRELMDMLRKEGVGAVFKWIVTSALALIVLGLAALVYRHS